MGLTAGSFRLFRVAGIDVFLHWTWFLVAWVEISLRPNIYQNPAWNVAEYVALFAIVLLHEFGHALACRSVGGQADRIVLWPLGGIAYVAPPPRPGPVLWSIAAGPLVNVLLLFVSIALIRAAPEAFVLHHGLQKGAADIPDLSRFLGSLIVMNAILLVFNLVPVYPLDGGQIVQALLWFFVGRWRSLMYVSIVGAFFGFLLCFGAPMLGLWGISGWWLLSLMGAFILFRSVVGFLQSRQVLFLRGLPRHENCACPRCGTEPPKGPFWVCEHCHTRFDLFDSHGKCPACGAWYLQPECPHCRATNHIDKWFPPPEEGASAAALPGSEAKAPPG